VARRFSTLCALFLIAWSACQAQVVPGDTSAVKDSAVVAPGILTGDTLHLFAAPGKSTGLAMLLSAVLPGAGQVYNESYWKAPLVLGLGVYFAAEFIRNNRYADDYRQLYLASPGDPNAAAYKGLREDYKNLRDANAWYFVILYVLNIVDAYVDASLYGFDVSPTLSLRGVPGNLGLSLRVGW
jgi:hypothetical protein